MRSFELRILVLHPRLDDDKDYIKIWQSNEKVLKPLPGKFSDPWICEIRYANAEKEVNAMITLRCILKNGDPEFCNIIDTFCDELFRVGGDRSLESIRNGEEVLFKPVFDTENNDVDRAFFRSFIMSMGKSLTEDLTFKDPETLGNNFFTRHPVRWFMGPMKAVVTLAECVQGLGQFLELVPPRTIASTNYHATTYIEHPPSESVELQDTAKRVEMVLRIMRRGAVTTNLIEEGLLQLVRLDEGELNRAINDASQFLDNTTEVLLSTLDTVLGKGKAPVTIGTRSDEHEGEMSLDSINIAVDSLKSSIEQTGQLFKLADEETAAYKNTCKKWAGFTALSLIPIAIGCSIPGASVAATAARVVCIGGGAIPTAVCGYKTWKEWWSWDDSDQVRKLVAKVHQVFCCTWIFLTIDLWRRNGLSDDDERLLEFAKRMAEAFGINNLRNNWGSNDYATQLITKNRSLIAQDMRNIMDAVHKRRNIPRESQSAGEDSAHPVNPDHNVQQQTVVEINGQNLLQSSISSAESEPTLSELDSSSAISETDDSTAGLHGRLNEFLIPAPSESNGWGSVNGSDLDLSGSHTPTEVSNYWDD